MHLVGDGRAWMDVTIKNETKYACQNTVILNVKEGFVLQVVLIKSFDKNLLMPLKLGY